jgi:hypothetical protein
LQRERVVADLAEAALERAFGVGVHGERRLHAGVEFPHVALSDVGVDLHTREILSDREQRRSLERRGDGLPHVDVARDDDAVDGRDDEVCLCRFELRVRREALLLKC